MSARRSGSVTLALGTAGCVLLNCSNPANAPSEATRRVETKAVALAPPTPALGDFVLYAARSVTLGASDVVSFR
jgi:hypothetical protein